MDLDKDLFKNSQRLVLGSLEDPQTILEDLLGSL